MISHISLVVFGLLLINITIVVQTVPVGSIKKSNLLSKIASPKSVDLIKPSLISSNSKDTLKNEHKIVNNKKKRYIPDYYQFDDLLDDIKHTLHPTMKETPAQIHDNIDKLSDIDNSKTFTEIKMNPNELIKVARKRRSINLNDGSNQRHKRALSTYDFYNTDPSYESFIEQDQFIRPSRAFAPMYWNPFISKRNIHSDLTPSFEELPLWNKVYMDTMGNDDDDDNRMLLINNNNEDEDENEYNRYPILSDSSSIPYDNLQAQQAYNIDDLPINEDDEYFSTRYEPIENYFK